MLSEDAGSGSSFHFVRWRPNSRIGDRDEKDPGTFFSHLSLWACRINSNIDSNNDNDDDSSVGSKWRRGPGSKKGKCFVKQFQAPIFPAETIVRRGADAIIQKLPGGALLSTGRSGSLATGGVVVEVFVVFDIGRQELSRTKIKSCFISFLVIRLRWNSRIS